MKEFIFWVGSFLGSIWLHSFLLSLSPPMWTVFPVFITFTAFNIFVLRMAVKAYRKYEQSKEWR